MGILSSTLAQIKLAGAEALHPETIERVCRDAGLTWRDRLLTPVVTLQAFLSFTGAFRQHRLPTRAASVGHAVHRWRFVPCSQAVAARPVSSLVGSLG